MSAESAEDRRTQQSARTRIQILKQIAQPIAIKRGEQFVEDSSEVECLRRTGDRMKAMKTKVTKRVKKGVLDEVIGLFNAVFKQKHRLLSTRAEEIRARVRWMQGRQDMNSRLSTVELGAD
jgi:hypothetical protein